MEAIVSDVCVMAWVLPEAGEPAAPGVTTEG